MVDWIAIASDVPEIIGLIEAVEAGLSKLPPVAQRTANDYLILFNSLDGQVLNLILKLKSQLSPPATPTPVK